jgi:hypothetical protein
LIYEKNSFFKISCSIDDDWWFWCYLVWSFNEIIKTYNTQS